MREHCNFISTAFRDKGQKKKKSRQTTEGCFGQVSGSGIAETIKDKLKNIVLGKHVDCAEVSHLRSFCISSHILHDRRSFKLSALWDFLTKTRQFLNKNTDSLNLRETNTFKLTEFSFLSVSQKNPTCT